MPPWVDKLLNSQFVQLGLAALAFLIALWLVVVIARLLMGGRLRLPGGRTRQARLGIVDAFDLDRQRQLIIVRRDNTEHLIMIGGPNDLVIESEIVRVEARDFREGRREKGFDGFNEGARVPAPFATPALGTPPQGAPLRQEEPLLPMALPQTAPQVEVPVPLDVPLSANVEPAPTRAPTFPLPPRRPTPPLQPDRRPSPTIPERIAPTLEAVNVPEAADAPVQPPRPGAPPAPAAQVSRPAPPVADTANPAPRGDGPAAGTAPVRPTPFLKPLPPRAPLRPLKRTTPQVEPVATPAPSFVEPTNPQPGQPLPPARPAAAFPPPAGPNFTQPTSTVPADDGDGLASLEEEMAKLLGR